MLIIIYTTSKFRQYMLLPIQHTNSAIFMYHPIHCVPINFVSPSLQSRLMIGIHKWLLLHWKSIICWLFCFKLLLFVISNCKQNFEPTKNSYANMKYTHMQGGFLFDTFKTIWMFPSSNHVQSPCEHKPLHNVYIIPSN